MEEVVASLMTTSLDGKGTVAVDPAVAGVDPTVEGSLMGTRMKRRQPQVLGTSEVDTWC